MLAQIRFNQQKVDEMPDKTTNLEELKAKVREFVEARDWTKYHNPKDIAISIGIEASELVEIFQWVKESEIDSVLSNPEKLDNLREELADIFVYCLSMANSLNIDISDAIVEKIQKNMKKYPIDKVKGNYKKYTGI